MKGLMQKSSNEEDKSSQEISAGLLINDKSTSKCVSQTVVNAL